MGVNSLPKTVTWQRRGCDLNAGLFAPESSTLTHESAERVLCVEAGRHSAGVQYVGVCRPDAVVIIQQCAECRSACGRCAWLWGRRAHRPRWVHLLLSLLWWWYCYAGTVHAVTLGLSVCVSATPGSVSQNIPSLRRSVVYDGLLQCLSLTSWNSTKLAKCKTMVIVPHSSPETL